MLPMRKIIVVGDKFWEFSDDKEVITVSELEMLSKIPTKMINENIELILGQGVNFDEIRHILSRSSHLWVIDGAGVPAVIGSCDRNKYTHKHNPANTLISGVLRQAETLFEASLLVDEYSELMNDHQTGQHIQGMVLVEAFRQMFIAVTSEYFVSEKETKKYYVINEMNIEFQNFLFPLPAIIKYEVLEKKITSSKGKFKANIRALQNGKSCALMQVSFSVYNADIIRKKESELATEIVDAFLAIPLDRSKHNKPVELHH